MDKTPRMVKEINGKPFGFEVSDYKGKLYLVGREMYHDEAGDLIFGRNGINLPITTPEQVEQAVIYIRNLVATLAGATGMSNEDIVADIDALNVDG